MSWLQPEATVSLELIEAAGIARDAAVIDVGGGASVLVDQLLHVEESDRDRYREILTSSLAPGGSAVIGTFAEDGPERCSGLPVARYSDRGLAEFLGEGFAVSESRHEVHRTPSGSTQAFTWVLARRSG